jgi:hypothetical protein
MKISIIINILNSHEVVRRQIEHFKSLDLTDEVEILFIDDGSNPPLSFPGCGLKNFAIYPTNDKRPWTQGLARNFGAAKAKGEYLMMTDIDHIFGRESIEAVLKYSGDKMVFFRYYGILNENGELKIDIKTLSEFGLDMNRTKGKRGFCAGVHGNTFAIKKSIFFELGGYQEQHCIGMMHQGKRKGEDSYFSMAYSRQVSTGKYNPVDAGPKMYFFPIGRFQVNGDTNPHGLFHNLSYDPVKQPMME